MARFSLSSHPWELIFVYRVHNSTVARQLRYALTKERLCCRAVTPASSLIIEKYQAIHIYCAASGATYEYALDIFAALFVRVTASL